MVLCALSLPEWFEAYAKETAFEARRHFVWLENLERASRMTVDYVLLIFAVLIVSFLYSSVGHAGASGYIAVMTLFGLAPSVIKPAALVLNILVASLTAWQFWRAGHFSWRLFW